RNRRHGQALGRRHVPDLLRQRHLGQEGVHSVRYRQRHIPPTRHDLTCRRQRIVRRHRAPSSSHWFETFRNHVPARITVHCGFTVPTTSPAGNGDHRP